MNQNAQYELHHIPKFVTCNQTILKSMEKTQPLWDKYPNKMPFKKKRTNDLQAFAKKFIERTFIKKLLQYIRGVTLAKHK